MAGKAYKERILVQYEGVQNPDGQGGFEAGTAVNLYAVKATIIDKPANPITTDTTKISNVQSFEFVYDPQKPISTKHWVMWRGVRRNIYAVELSDTQKRVTVKTGS